MLYTSLNADIAAPLELLRRWKHQGELERRFSDRKGPLLVHPVFVNTPQRIAALILLLHLALLIHCLIEREARRLLAAQGKTKFPQLLAGQVDAVPTLENILRMFQSLLLLVEDGPHDREAWVNFFHPEQEALWKFFRLDLPAPT